MPKITINIKVMEGDYCVVKNYRKRPAQWENGTVTQVSCGIRQDGTTHVSYSVTLDRVSESKSRFYPNGGAPLFITVSDDGIDEFR